MKPLLVLYCPIVETEQEIEDAKQSLGDVLNDYHLVFIMHSSFQKPKLELLTIDEKISPLDLEELERKLKRSIGKTMAVTRIREITKASKASKLVPCCPTCNMNDWIVPSNVGPDEKGIQYLYRCMRCEELF